ncbi:hypothetical protein HNV11_21365 [Spirosoma taeanense]|uniref:DUF308 domain-containing protein n=1 Tax=Spirosoma taeanense TaxID=2735870 RepID=A0A6M5YCC6_9BACT|nr:DUF308 domain-containing protein [Spirosoma taeanense]QJW91747.1 hypothetical protein HNV11_21365 [Spirosoma taeanense]
MEHTHPAPRWWLLLARSAIYVLIGILMFVFAASYTAQSGYIIGILAILAGVGQLVFSFANRGTESNNLWGILHGLTDLAFGIAIFAFSQGTIKGFVDVLGFWAMMYAFLQSVQAMYAFLAARGGTGVNLSSVFVHFANVVTSGALTFMLLLRPAGFDETLSYVGVFPIVLGVLIFILTNQMRAQASRTYHHQ